MTNENEKNRGTAGDAEAAKKGGEPSHGGSQGGSQGGQSQGGGRGGNLTDEERRRGDEQSHGGSQGGQSQGGGEQSRGGK